MEKDWEIRVNIQALVRHRLPAATEREQMLRRQAELKVQALAANLENAVTVLLTDLVRRESREDHGR
jgi:hypothetical protein